MAALILPDECGGTSYKTRSYYTKDRAFDSYEPGYQYGWENAGKSEFAKKSFEETEPVLQQRWSAEPGAVGRPTWADSREPIQSGHGTEFWCECPGDLSPGTSFGTVRA